MSSLWTDAVWEDPDGGTVIVHGTMPTVVYPNAMRPRVDWHGLALLESPDIVDLWVQEEADEAESQGINLTHAPFPVAPLASTLRALRRSMACREGVSRTLNRAASSETLTATTGRCSSSNRSPMTTTGAIT